MNKISSTTLGSVKSSDFASGYHQGIEGAVVLHHGRDLNPVDQHMLLLALVATFYVRKKKKEPAKGRKECLIRNLA